LTFRYVWESKADGAFAISEDTWNEPLGRGTEIKIHLKEEAGEYVEEFKLKVFPNLSLYNQLLDFKITCVLFEFRLFLLCVKKRLFLLITLWGSFILI
jgi:HSP90 family molecular chaperone